MLSAERYTKVIWKLFIILFMAVFSINPVVSYTNFFPSGKFANSDD